ncbi:MAG: glycosyltransferase family protein [bacterium]|nr:glycosyltransferase family protein [bacterium]
MRILYGVAGQGSGHATRSRAVLEHLRAVGHDVHVVAHDASFAHLHDDFPTTRITGLEIAYAENRVQIIRTAFANALRAPGNTRSIDRVRRVIDTFDPQVVCSDYEPIVGMIARLKHRPLLSIDNIHALTRTDIAVPPRHTLAARTARTVTELVNAGSDAYVVTAFAPLMPTRPNTHVVPPLLRDAVLRQHPRRGRSVLVYSTSADRELLDVLQRVRAHFIVYGIPRGRRAANITSKRPNPTTFLRDLATCRAVIATAGFTLMTEALHFGKPLLAHPIAGQFEQIANGLLLEELGYGKMWETLDRERVEAFLYNGDGYADALARYPRHDNTKAFTVIDRLIERLARRP